MKWCIFKTSQRSHSLERAEEVKFFPQWSGEGQKYVMSMSSDICNFCTRATGCQKFSDIRYKQLRPEPLVSLPRDQETKGCGDENATKRLMKRQDALRCALRISEKFNIRSLLHFRLLGKHKIPVARNFKPKSKKVKQKIKKNLFL